MRSKRNINTVNSSSAPESGDSKATLGQFFRDLWKIILVQKSDVKPTDNRRVCKELPIACADGTRSDPSSTRVRAAVQATMHEVRGRTAFAKKQLVPVHVPTRRFTLPF